MEDVDGGICHGLATAWGPVCHCNAGAKLGLGETGRSAGWIADLHHKTEAWIQSREAAGRRG